MLEKHPTLHHPRFPLKIENIVMPVYLRIGWKKNNNKRRKLTMRGGIEWPAWL